MHKIITASDKPVQLSSEFNALVLDNYISVAALRSTVVNSCDSYYEVELQDSNDVQFRR